MTSIFIAFSVSFLLSLIIIRYKTVHQHLTGDHEVEGIQKFHNHVVPRIGGLSIFFGFAAGALVQRFQNTSQASMALYVLLAGVLAFSAGFVEDITKKVGITYRLIATFGSAIVSGVVLDGWLIRTDTIIDPILASSFLIVVLLTAVCVAGVSNAFNIIDGYNGLSSGVAIIILIGLVYVSGKVGDRSITMASLILIGSIVGFLIWNYPKGHIFLGDGGAYFIGFMIAELSLLLVVRNNSVSPWFPILLVFYPIFETLYTIFRRLVLEKSHPGMPDAAHLHQLIYKSIVNWVIGEDDDVNSLARNSMTSPYLWVISSVCVIPALLFWQNTQMLQFFVLCFGLIYVALYKWISKK